MPDFDRRREQQRGGPPAGGDRGQGGPPQPGGNSDEARRERIRAVFGASYEQGILEPGEERYNEYLNQVKSFVERRARNITPAQLRNIFASVNRAAQPHDVHVLRPQLAYVAGRADREEMRELVVLLDDLIVKVDTVKKLKAFQQFFEAVIAYHKFYNPKGG